DLPRLEPGEPLRPRALAVLMLASRDLLPRQRARDQQADLAGMQLKGELLAWVVAVDPDPNDLETALVKIVNEMGGPSGPARAIAATFQEEWQAACASPEWVAQMLGEAMQRGTEERPRGQAHRR